MCLVEEFEPVCPPVVEGPDSKIVGHEEDAAVEVDGKVGDGEVIHEDGSEDDERAAATQ